MIPRDYLWPVDECWHFHCGLNEFDNLERYQEAIRLRYGEADGLDEFTRKAQALNYELMRPMFEAFRVNRGRATGVVQWMLNAAWPKMYWQLYDWYLMPTGAFYAARKACQSPQLVYNYGDNAVYLVNDRLVDVGDLTADIRIYDIESRLFLATHFGIDAGGRAAQKVFTLPELENISTAWFLSLRLFDRQNRVIADNFYWLSTVPDELDYDAKVELWEYYTPSKRYADFRMLNAMPAAEVTVAREEQAQSEKGVIAVTLTNRSDKIAFFVELTLLDDKTGAPVVPVFWQDNYVSLLPHEERVVAVSFAPAVGRPALRVCGWNVEQRTG
jgi:exo-1,4-beta-D-glucosaminidase